MASPTESAAVFARMEDMLGNVGDSLARVVLAGELNSEQSMRMSIALLTITGLQQLFGDERARVAAAPIGRRKAK